ncbi:hypothetical protein GQ53DRAFT_667060 [Thozetella sp. PMI_491]|nr:hypothetical protein GQ53DRAFT_667060 [Thozetella sp. PMI_491]
MDSQVSNTAAFSQADWATEINKAKTAGIDAFALNMAYGEATTQSQLPLAFAAANAAGFKLFFSIDYAGNGLWPKADVLSLLKRWIPDGAYYRNGAKPMVSTFEGTAAAKDWTDIKAQTGCYFIPDWSSLGAKDALQIAPGVPDGLFNWAGWPVGDRKMNNFVDASYALFLGGRPIAPEASVPNYMMPVSPWFYTNMPGFNKNWMWKGDNLWYDRWMEVLVTQPEFVQIVSWNDFGESHYVGTLRQSPPFADGKAAFDYVSGMPHEGWLSTLPYWTSMYKTGTASITKESITTWYLKHHPSSCDNGGTTVNTASHLQAESWPGSDVGNTLYVDAVLASPADVEVEVGSEILAFKWTNVPDGNVGVYHGSVNLNGRTGFVSVGLWRGTGLLGSITGVPIGGCDPSGKANFNPWVGSQTTGNVPATSPPHKVSDMKCVEGFSVGNFNSICQFACKNGYCPRGACVCTKLGPPPKIPDPVFQRGYSKNGDPNFGGLCDFSCNLGYCPSDVCSKTPTPEVIPKSSPFTPDTCTSGSANRMAGQGISVDVLCQEACFYGYCPIKACNCNSLGVLNDHPAADISIVGYPARTLGGDTVVRDICTFLCQIGKCGSWNLTYPLTPIILTRDRPERTL